MEVYVIAVAVQIGIYSLMTMGLNLQYGFTGLINFGVVAFYCIGSYGVAILAVKGFSPLIAIAAGIVACVLAAWFVGLLTLRLRGDFLAILTLGLSESLRIIAINEDWLTRGSSGIPGIPKMFEDSGETFLLLIILAVNAVAFYVFYRLVHSPYGRAIRAIRDDEDAFKSLGKDPLPFRLTVLVTGCIFMGVAGALQTYSIGFVSPEQFYPEVSFLVWMALIIGGVGTTWGPMVGAVALFGFLEGSRFIRDLDLGISEVDLASFRLALVGLVLVLLILYWPQGIAGNKRSK